MVNSPVERIRRQVSDRLREFMPGWFPDVSDTLLAHIYHEPQELGPWCTYPLRTKSPVVFRWIHPDDPIRWREPVLGIVAENGEGRTGQKITIPLRLLRRSTGERYVLYHISHTTDPDLPEQLRGQCAAGYYGVTGRSPTTRWNEHSALAATGKGFALHTAWHYLLDKPGEVILRIVDTAPTLPDIYALEEAAVARETLTPRGLNVIPGGYAGVRRLYELGLSTNKKLGPEERERILIQLEQTERAGPRAHYRRGHVRQLDVARLTWVSACFVALAGAFK